MSVGTVWLSPGPSGSRRARQGAVRGAELPGTVDDAAAPAGSRGDRVQGPALVPLAGGRFLPSGPRVSRQPGCASTGL